MCGRVKGRTHSLLYPREDGRCKILLDSLVLSRSTIYQAIGRLGVIRSCQAQDDHHRWPGPGSDVPLRACITRVVWRKKQQGSPDTASMLRFQKILKFSSRVIPIPVTYAYCWTKNRCVRWGLVLSSSLPYSGHTYSRWHLCETRRGDAKRVVRVIY